MGSRIASILVILASLPVVAAPAERLTYEPLSTEARKLGRLEKYASIEKKPVSLQLGEVKLDVRVPVSGDAYDTIPIEYTLAGKADPDNRVAIEAVAFEDDARRKGRDLYDLAVPGNMKLKIEYLGSQTGIFDPKRVTRLTQTSRHEVFPPYTLEPFVRSGTVKRGNYLFFKFRITNVGDTVLDAEGFGGWMAWPEAVKDAAKGEKGLTATTINQFERHLEYLYPGESFEQWIHFWCAGQDMAHCRTLPVGKYKARYRAAYRMNTEWHWGVNMWAGQLWTGLEVPIEVTETGGQSEATTKDLEIEPARADRMTRYVHSLEEFMTSLQVFEREQLASPQKGTIHVQVAPWTRHIIIKLIGNTPGRIKTVAVPVAVSTASLRIRPNPANPFIVRKRGRKEPAFCTQDMSAMRTSIQLGPNPEQHLPARLQDMMDCGVNVLCSTSGDWHHPEISNPNAFAGDACAETFKYYYDVLTRRFQVPVFGCGLFPCRTPNLLATGSFFWNRKFDVPTVGSHYSYSGTGDLDVGHPDYPALQAGVILFNFRRWGDTWYRTADGDVLIDVEDTWGWLRDDINVRYFLGEHAMKRFHAWLRKKYSNRIDRVNKAWGTSYTAFEEIDPQANQGNEGKAFGADLKHIAPVYNKKDNPFHDWTPAIDDWDIFRTELRCDVYQEILRIVRKEIPRAQINIRTEGGFLPVMVPADSQDAHLRHCYYTQRRQALVAEVLARRKVFKYHSDYTTIPYTESEWRYLLKQLSKQGMRGNYLPQFCTARDMVLNDKWGRDFQVNYNLDQPTRAVMMHVLQAAYPVWKVTYDEGHCPGVLWEDYMCDGFVTETQKRELKLFREHLNAAK